jgi:hypothetical protein
MAQGSKQMSDYDYDRGYNAGYDRATGEIEALESLVAWRPIETAPKDGTHVDLWAGEERVADCRWNISRSRWEHWGWGDYDGMDMVKVDFEPTHWIPIPSAPLKEEGGP